MKKLLKKNRICLVEQNYDYLKMGIIAIICDLVNKNFFENMSKAPSRRCVQQSAISRQPEIIMTL
jgi:hypothetical protein